MGAQTSGDKSGTEPFLQQTKWTCPDRADLSRSVHAPHMPVHVSQDRPYSVPEILDEKLAHLRDYWAGLKRGNADIPFADDLKLGQLPHPASIFLLRVFEKPERFRFDVVGSDLTRSYGCELSNRFADEIGPRSPLDYFLSQCSATVAAHAGTFYRHVPAERDRQSYQRLLLPLWADGHIAALLGAIVTP